MSDEPSQLKYAPSLYTPPTYVYSIFPETNDIVPQE